MFFLAATAVDNHAMCNFSGSGNAKQNDFSNGDQLNFWRHTTERWLGIYSLLH